MIGFLKDKLLKQLDTAYLKTVFYFPNLGSKCRHGNPPKNKRI